MLLVSVLWSESFEVILGCMLLIFLLIPLSCLPRIPLFQFQLCNGYAQKTFMCVLYSHFSSKLFADTKHLFVLILEKGDCVLLDTLFLCSCASPFIITTTVFPPSTHSILGSRNINPSGVDLSMFSIKYTNKIRVIVIMIHVYVYIHIYIMYHMTGSCHISICICIYLYNLIHKTSRDWMPIILLFTAKFVEQSN